MVESGVDGDRGGNEGVRSPYFGSTALVSFQNISEDWRSNVYLIMMTKKDKGTYQKLQRQSYRPY